MIELHDCLKGGEGQKEASKDLGVGSSIFDLAYLERKELVPFLWH